MDINYMFYDFSEDLVKNRLKRKGLPVQNKLNPTVPRGPVQSKRPFPGPDTYLIRCKLTQRSAPEYTFGSRPLSRKKEFPGPSPTEYNVFGLISKGKIYPNAPTIKPRRKSLEKFVTPGPSDYYPEDSLMKICKTPAFTIKGRYKERIGNDNPAPDSFRLPPMIGPTKDGRHPKAPAHVIAGRFYRSREISTPGPADYDAGKICECNKKPGFTFGQRYTKKKLLVTPGPATYRAHKVDVNKSYPPDFTFSQKYKTFVPDRRIYFENEIGDSWTCP